MRVYYFIKSSSCPYVNKYPCYHFIYDKDKKQNKTNTKNTKKKTTGRYTLNEEKAHTHNRITGFICKSLIVPIDRFYYSRPIHCSILTLF